MDPNDEIPKGLDFSVNAFFRFANQLVGENPHNKWNMRWECAESHGGSRKNREALNRLIPPELWMKWTGTRRFGVVMVSSLPEESDLNGGENRTFFFTPKGELVAEIVHPPGFSMQGLRSRAPQSKRATSDLETPDSAEYGSIYYYPVFPPMGSVTPGEVMTITQVRRHVVFYCDDDRREVQDEAPMEVMGLKSDEEPRVRGSLPRGAREVATSGGVRKALAGILGRIRDWGL